MSDFSIREMLTMQQTLQEKWRCPRLCFFFSGGNSCQQSHIHLTPPPHPLAYKESAPWRSQ